LSTLSNGQSGSALKRSGSVLHSRAKSIAAYVPKLSPSTAPETVDQHPQQPNRIFGNLFNGESAPVHLGLAPPSPTKEESEIIMEYKPAFTERPAARRRQSTAQSKDVSTGTRASGWFNRKATPSSAPAPPQDEILAVNINNALFPHGPADQLSPHAFNDLLLNATSLLQRMQAAYKQKVDYIASIQPEIDAQKEEVEEAETRSRHLKIQLEDMSRKADEQATSMQELCVQLAEERVKVQDAREQAQNASKLVRLGDDEDTPRRRKRGSAGSASDSGFESDAEYADSVISAGGRTPLSPPTVMLTPDLDRSRWQSNPGRVSGRPDLLRQSTSRLSRLAVSSNGHDRHGDGESVAWDAADNLRSENRNLRKQVEEMRKTLQGCIDFVNIVNV